jgi:hypothetical protein
MRQGQPLYLELSSDNNQQLVALAVIRLVEDLADEMVRAGDRAGLEYLAYRATRMTNNLCFAASEAGEAQRRRLAQHTALTAQDALLPQAA